MGWDGIGCSVAASGTLPRVVGIARSDKKPAPIRTLLCATFPMQCTFLQSTSLLHHREEEEAVDRHYIRCCLDEAPPSGDS